MMRELSTQYPLTASQLPLNLWNPSRGPSPTNSLKSVRNRLHRQNLRWRANVEIGYPTPVSDNDYSSVINTTRNAPTPILYNYEAYHFHGSAITTRCSHSYNSSGVAQPSHPFGPSDLSHASSQCKASVCYGSNGGTSVQLRVNFALAPKHKARGSYDTYNRSGARTVGPAGDGSYTASTQAGEPTVCLDTTKIYQFWLSGSDTPFELEISPLRW